MNDRLSPAELINLRPRKPAAPSPAYEPLVKRLFTALDEHVTRCHLGRVWQGVEVVLDRREGLVLQPDITFIVDGRESIVSDRVWGPPDMVLEVTSPLTHSARLEERVAWFSMYGAREFWVVEAEHRELAILELAHGGVRRRTLVDQKTPVSSVLLPEFNRSLADLLAH